MLPGKKSGQPCVLESAGLNSQLNGLLSLFLEV